MIRRLKLFSSAMPSDDPPTHRRELTLRMDNLYIDMKASWRKDPPPQIPSTAVAQGGETEPSKTGAKGEGYVRCGDRSRNGFGISLPAVAIHAPAASSRHTCYSGALRVLSWFPNSEVGHLHLSLVEAPGMLTRQALSSFLVDARTYLQNLGRLTLSAVVVCHHCSTLSGNRVLPPIPLHTPPY